MVKFNYDEYAPNDEIYQIVLYDFPLLRIFTVPTTCSRPSTKMLAFIFVCLFYLRKRSPGHSVQYFCLKFASTSARTV